MMNEAFSGPIPGQSLTKPLGASPVDNPPQYPQLDDALEHIWQTISEPRQLTRLFLMLKKGVPVEYIAKTIIFTGFSKGMWTPDVGLMMLRTVMGMIMTLAHVKGIKHVIFNPDKEQNDFLDQFMDMAPESGPKETDEPKSTEPPKFTGLLGGSL